MKSMKALFLSIMIVSCASHKRENTIANSSYDALKFESLSRFDEKRLGVNSNSALKLCYQGEYDQANELFNQNLDKNINNYTYWNEIGTCYILQEKYSQAKRFFDIALSNTKKNFQKAVIINNLGVILLKLDNNELAKEYFKKSIKLNKRALTPKFNLAKIYLRYSNYTAADELIKDLLKQSTQDVDFLHLYGHSLLMQKKYERALMYYDKIPKYYQSRDDIASNMAMAYYMLGKLDLAKQILEKTDKSNQRFVKSQELIKDQIEKAWERRGNEKG